MQFETFFSPARSPRWLRGLVITLTLAATAACQSPGEAPAEQASAAQATTVRKSPNDTREYRYLELPNRMRVVLVSDPATDKSAAALSVYRGSIHEPENRPGLAHFLEHMLFIQTETYPEIDGFQKHIRANGGSSNAYTAPDHTNYFFDIQPEAFAEGLDRFGHFFIDPILSAEYAAREKNAVHSEYQMQLKDDGWRGFMVRKQALNPNHPGRRFTIGSLATLKGDIQADLRSFFEENYSADQMGLVVLSRESLDDLEALVRPIFEQVGNQNIGSSYITQPMYADGQLPALLRTQSQKDGATISFQFPIPSTLPNYAVKPEQYFANLVGHEGEGSLYQLLKRRGWIESLGSSVSDFDRSNSVFGIAIELTPEGREQWQAVAHLLFQYIELVKDTPPQRWLYDEQARVAELGFRFQEKSRPMGLVYQLAPRLDKYPPGDLLVAPYLMERFDAEAISATLQHLRPDNVLVEMTAPDIETTSVEPWFEVPFALERTSIPQTPTDSSGLTLPSRNPFLPEDLALRTPDEAGLTRALDRPGLTLWHDLDVQFGSPRAFTNLELTIPDGLEAPEDRAMGQLYRLMVQDSLSELAYPAYLAGLGYRVGVTDAGFEVSVSGYHDKQLVLLGDVLKHLTTASLKPERFEALKASLIKDWRNTAKERPYSQVFAALDDTLRSGRWPRPILIDALQKKDLDDLLRWRESKLARVGVIGMLHGNVGPERVAALETMLATSLSLAETAKHRARVREVRNNLRLNVAVDHDDAAMVLHVQNPDDSFASRARSSLAAQILQPEYFRELRTEQQLGYVVSVSNRPVVKRGGITFIVQSPVLGAAGLEAATTEFMARFNARWPDVSDAEFAKYKAGLINRLRQSPKNLGELAGRYWGDLMDGYLTFDSREQVAQIVETLPRAAMTGYFQTIEDQLANQRLLIYSVGKFEEAPSEGRLLESATAALEGAQSAAGS